MANNRLMLKCGVCSQTVYLAKRFAEAYFVPDYVVGHKGYELQSFFEQHAKCYDDVVGPDHFVVEYEIEPPSPI